MQFMTETAQIWWLILFHWVPVKFNIAVPRKKVEINEGWNYRSTAIFQSVVIQSGRVIVCGYGTISKHVMWEAESEKHSEQD